MREQAVHLTVTDVYAEFDQPAKGIPHLERVNSIYKFLLSPIGDMPNARPILIAGMTLTEARIVDLQERAGIGHELELELNAVENGLEMKLSAVEKSCGIKDDGSTRQALAALRGALLANQGKHAEAEKPLLARYEALTRSENPAREFVRGERVATIRRLVKLYTAWARPIDASSWADRLPRD
jgi:hypothetical protein